MKKITPVILAAVLIVIGCIFVAGCVTTPAAQDSQQPEGTPAVSIDKENPAYSVTVKTSGNDPFATGAIFELQFPDNGASTGYVWEVVDGKDILYKEFTVQPSLSPSGLLGAAPKSSMKSLDSVQTVGGEEELPLVGASGAHHFWFQPAEAGDYKITLKYAQPWEKGDTCAVYSQTIHVVDSDDLVPNGAKTSYIFDSFSVNPAAGETVKVIKEANPTTGYYCTVSGEGLVIDDEDAYKADNNEPGFAGSSGQYEWCVTAEKAGDYTLKAELKHAGSDEVLSVFEIPMKFV